jgi:hypothetical protein
LLPFATPGKDHAAHRLANLGLGQRGAVLGMYILGALSGSIALLVSFLPIPISLGVLAFAIILAVAGIAFLERAPYERQTGKSPAASAAD